MVSGKLISRPHWQGQVSERGWAIGRRLDSRGSLLDSRGSLVPLPTTAISSPPREILLEAAAESQRARPLSPRMAFAALPHPPATTTTTTTTEVIAVTITDPRDSNSSSHCTAPSIDIALSVVAHDPDEGCGRAADNGGAASPATGYGTAREQGPRTRPGSSSSNRSDGLEGGAGGGAGSAAAGGFLVGMSPRLEMRLALNQDIMNDEDLINYGNGLDLATILGHDLSSYQRRTGRELLSRSPQQRFIAPTRTTALAGGTASSCISPQPQLQQNNSKMDTPTLSRRRASPSTWNSFVSVDRAGDSDADETRSLSDLEKLARHEKMLTARLLRSGPRAVPTEDFHQPQEPRTSSSPLGHTSTHSTPKRRTMAL